MVLERAAHCLHTGSGESRTDCVAGMGVDALVVEGKGKRLFVVD
jgi:hypothetical protein